MPRSARRCRATSAAAPATGRSSRPCAARPRRGITPDRDDAIAFYWRELGREVRIGADEELVLERDGTNVIAAVRLAPEEGALVLRTMVVAERSQRRGVGARLLQRATRVVGDRECYCVAWSYLESLYGRAGFQPVTAEALPPHLRARLGEGLIAMRREARR